MRGSLGISDHRLDFVVETIRNEFGDGEFVAEELAPKLGTSAGWARVTLARLYQMGAIERRRGRGEGWRGFKYSLGALEEPGVEWRDPSDPFVSDEERLRIAKLSAWSAWRSFAKIAFADYLSVALAEAFKATPPAPVGHSNPRKYATRYLKNSAYWACLAFRKKIEERASRERKFAAARRRENGARDRRASERREAARELVAKCFEIAKAPNLSGIRRALRSRLEADEPFRPGERATLDSLGARLGASLFPKTDAELAELVDDPRDKEALLSDPKEAARERGTVVGAAIKRRTSARRKAYARLVADFLAR